MPNVTMSIEADLLKRARKIAVEKDTTLTGLFRAYLAELVKKEDVLWEVAAAELGSLFAKSRVVVGHRTWSRDDLHAR